MFRAASAADSTRCRAVTGPYATAIFEELLGAAPGTVINGEPLPDFGGHHPDPNLVHAKHLFDLAMSPDAPDLCAASDGDGDRNLIIGRGQFVTPSDSLAILAANAHLAPGYAAGIAGIARSMPTSRRRRPGRGKSSGSACTRRRPAGNSSAICSTPGIVTICGEESAGTGSNHVREKDGLWAVLMWLNILAARKQSVRSHRARALGANTAAIIIRATITRKWRADGANALDQRACATTCRRLPGKRFGALEIASADDFAYHDPVDGSDSTQQGIRMHFDDGSRIVYRLSGTGTSGATLRVYIERYEPDPARPESGDAGRARRSHRAVARDREDRALHRARGPLGDHLSNAGAQGSRRLTPGRPEPLGAVVEGDGINVAVASGSAQAIFVCLFDADDQEVERFRLPGRTGDVFHGHVAGVGVGARYGLRAQGVFDPAAGQRFNPAKLLVDPLATRLDRPFRLDASLFDARIHGAAEDHVDSAAVAPKAIVEAAPRSARPGAPASNGATSSSMRCRCAASPRSAMMSRPALRGTFAGLWASCVHRPPDEARNHGCRTASGPGLDRRTAFAAARSGELLGLQSHRSACARSETGAWRI